MPRSSSQRFQPSQPSQPSPPSPSSQTSQSSPSSEPSQGPPPSPSDLASVLRTGPFHLALRTALSIRGLALHRVQQHLAQRGVHVGVTSLSYWQQGAPPPRACRIPARGPGVGGRTRAAGALADPAARSSAEPGRRPCHRADPPLPRPHLPRHSGGRAALRNARPRDTGLHTVTHIERIRIGADRQLLRRDSQHVLRAHRDRIDRYLAIYQGDPGCDVDQVRVRAVENCRPGRIRRDQGSRLILAELLLDRRLRIGDTHLLSYGFDDAPATEPSDEYLRGFNSGAAQYVLQASFHPEALPVRCHRFAVHTPGAAPYESEELTLDGHHCVHLVGSGLAPCLLGIRWDWE